MYYTYVFDPYIKHCFDQGEVTSTPVKENQIKLIKHETTSFLSKIMSLPGSKSHKSAESFERQHVPRK